MTIDEAYKAIPHQQTTFNPNSSNTSEAEASYLNVLFSVTDDAMRARVQTLQHFFYERGGMNLQRYNSVIARNLAILKGTPAPDSLKNIEQKIIKAVRTQQAFFEYWDSLKGKDAYNDLKASYTQNMNVRSAHKDLLEAYYELINLFPNETQQNRQAFFDHLCALDFI